MKLGKLFCSLLIFIILLPACNSAPATEALPTNTAPATALPTFAYSTPTTVPTAIPFSAVSTISFFSTPPPMDQLPTYTPTKILPTITPAPTWTLEPLSFQRLEGLRVAYSIDGNLYVQDSGEQAVQLTHSSQDYDPIFSDDGQKVVFYRGENQLWAINADGTGEQKLIILGQWSTFGQEYNERTELRSLVFVPGNHLFLFNTHVSRGRFDPPQLNNDLFLVDTDTAEIRQLLALGQGGDYLVSPDGKKIAVQMPDHIDVIDLQGQMVHQNLVTYPADNAHTEVPMFWMPDSKELIVLPSDIDPLTGGIPVLRQVWRYSLDGSAGMEIRLDPPPWKDAFSISPDGNWIAYSYEPSDLDPDAKAGVYIGNLRDGTSQLIFPTPVMASGFNGTVPLEYNTWSPDSVYFSCHYNEIYIGNIHGEFTSLGLLRSQEKIPAWIDGKHYLVDSGSVLVEVGKQKRYRVVELPHGVNQPSNFVFLGNGATP